MKDRRWIWVVALSIIAAIAIVIYKKKSTKEKPKVGDSSVLLDLKQRDSLKRETKIDYVKRLKERQGRVSGDGGGFFDEQYNRAEEKRSLEKAIESDSTLFELDTSVATPSATPLPAIEISDKERPVARTRENPSPSSAAIKAAEARRKRDSLKRIDSLNKIFISRRGYDYATFLRLKSDSIGVDKPRDQDTAFSAAFEVSTGPAQVVYDGGEIDLYNVKEVLYRGRRLEPGSALRGEVRYASSNRIQITLYESESGEAGAACRYKAYSEGREGVRMHVSSFEELEENVKSEAVQQGSGALNTRESFVAEGVRAVARSFRRRHKDKGIRIPSDTRFRLVKIQ